MKFLESDDQIAQEIMKIFVKQLHAELIAKTDEINARIKQKNIEVWKNTETYWSLLNGKLNHEFGFVKGTAEGKVNAVLEAMSKLIYTFPVKFKKHGSEYIGYRISILGTSIPERILKMEEASVQTETEAKSKFSDDFAAFSGGAGIDGGEGPRKELHWLEWLLLEGNNFIILNYRYEPIIAERSRSGKGLMVPDEDDAWKVPSEYSGTRQNHWLIRALKNERKYLLSEYGKIINEVLES